MSNIKEESQSVELKSFEDQMAWATLYAGFAASGHCGGTKSIAEVADIAFQLMKSRWPKQEHPYR